MDRDEVAGIDVLRPVALGEGLVGRRRVGGQRGGVGIDAAQLALPGMAMRVDETEPERMRRSPSVSTVMCWLG